MFFTSGSLNTYNEHIVADDRDWIAEFNYYYNGDWRVIGSSKLKSFQLSDYSTDGSNITMGSVVGGKLTVDLVDVASSIIANVGRGTHIKISLVLSSSGTPSSVIIKSDIFVIDDCRLKMKRDGNYNVSVTAYDLSYKMSDAYVASSNSMTAIEILTEIGNKYGFTLGDSVTEAISGVDGGATAFAPLADFTCKQTIGYMAGCYGCFAYFDSDMQLQFGWYKDDGNAIDNASIFNNSAYVSEMEERIIAILETGTKENPIVLPDNANGYSINFENPYITEEQATVIYLQKVAGGQLWYRIGKVSYRGSPLNNPGTVLYVSDTQGSLYSFYVMKRTLRYDGGLSETIESQGESETTINYKITSPTQQKINRALSRMEEAIKNATDIITQTKGSIFEIIPIDKNDPSKGNSGWKLYSTEIGSNNLILANSSGIGFSSNGGQSFNALALYIDENGIGHINANCIDVGKLSASVIDTSTLVVGTGNVEGLDDELNSLIDSINTAQGTANSASVKAATANSNASTALSTANTANSNASSALSVANTANGIIANWCYENDTTYIDGSNIYTGTITAKQIAAESITADKLAVGAITAEKVNVGWQSGNCATGWTASKEGYVTISSDSSYNYNPKITMSSSYTSGNIDVNGIPFYASAGDVLRFGGRAYKKSTGDNGIYLKYSEKSDGTYNVVENMWDNTSSSSVGATKDIDKSYTVTQPGWYMITVAFNTQASGAYVTNLYCYKDVKGEMIVNGRISSVDGETYFDLDTGEVALMSKNNEQLAFFNSATLKYEYVDSSTNKKYVVGGIEGFLKNNVVSQRRLIIHSPTAVEIGIGNDASAASGNSFYIADDGNGNVVADCLCNLRAQQNLSVLGTLAVQKPIGSQGEHFTGLTHTRTGDYVGTIKAGVGVIKPKVGDSRTSAALELSLNGSVEARLDVIPSWGSAKGVIYLSDSSGKSAPLELGTDDMWFNGTSIMNAISKINSTPIVDSGSVDFSPDGSFNTVYFNKTFTSTPNVVCTVEQFNAGTDDRYIVYLGTVTTTSFNARLIRFAGDLTYNCAVHWIAIGY